MRIVITGPTGAIGMALINKCIDNHISVLAVCHRSSGRRAQIPVSSYVEILELDLEEYGSFSMTEECRMKEKYDIFYHLAWKGTSGRGRDDMDLQQKNIAYALDAVRLARTFGCHTFVGAGSQAEYGRTEEALSEKTPVFPENGYGIAKLCAGQMTRILCAQLGMKHIWTRILSVYGPYDGAGSMISTTIRTLLQGGVPKLTEGIQMWDYLYSEDAAEALWLLGEKGKNGRIYCLGSGKPLRLKEYILCLRDAINPALPLEFGAVPYQEKSVMHLCADITALREDTGYEPKTDFEQGIHETIDWIRQQRNIE